ncbi:jg17188 [Pararge aegeria aegeria]|uniref:Jg17188 protein n=1 Tax=Pararge aegeria aegeria TaxID=348720 RepID=A0A8S4SDA7_9NEOP|nr:jg17188 [Pararge aegeria aegeria]
MPHLMASETPSPRRAFKGARPTMCRPVSVVNLGRRCKASCPPVITPATTPFRATTMLLGGRNKHDSTTYILVTTT